MQQASDRSLRELQRETEQTRAGLTQTVEQLKTSVTDTASEIRQRISPENIKAEVSDYVRSKGETAFGRYYLKPRVEILCRPWPSAQVWLIRCSDWQDQFPCRF